jgi:hypothetical protein
MAAQLTFEVAPAGTGERAIPIRRGWSRGACHRIRLTVQEMNYANRRLVEVQAPWIVDPRWDRR